MKLKTIMEEYLAYSKRFKANGTYRYDQTHLKSIMNYLLNQNLNDVSQLTFDTMYAYIDYCREQAIGNSTINKRIALLNRALRFSGEKNNYELPAVTTFPKLKEIDKRYDMVTENQMRKIIKYMVDLDNSFKNTRDKCVVFLFIDTGVRLSELTHVETKKHRF